MVHQSLEAKRYNFLLSLLSASLFVIFSSAELAFSFQTWVYFSVQAPINVECLLFQKLSYSSVSCYQCVRCLCDLQGFRTKQACIHLCSGCRSLSHHYSLLSPSLSTPPCLQFPVSRRFLPSILSHLHRLM